MRSMSLVALAVPLSISLAEAPQEASPSPDDLIKLVPVFKSSDAKCRTLEFEVKYRVNDHLKLRFRAFYLAPSRFRLTVTDALDEMPLLIMSDQFSVIYDPTEGVVFLVQNSQPKFAFRGTEDTLGFDLRLNVGSTAPAPPEVSADLRSTTDRPAKRFVFSDGNRRFRLLGVEDGDADRLQYLIHFDHAAKTPVTKVEYFHENGVREIVVERLRVNEPLDESQVDVPDPRTVARKIEITKVDSLVGLLANNVLAVVSRGSLARLKARRPDAITEPQLQELLKSVKPETVRLNDMKFGKSLKELFGPKLGSPPNQVPTK